MSSASAALRALLTSPTLSCLLEAYNAASALLVERAQVAGIWASSLTISCANGYRDNNTLSMSQVLDLLESITERTTKPLLFDGDTGYGDFAHVELLTRRLCARGVAGLCMEDKQLPKRNSFVESPSQQLATIKGFCGKLQAAREAATDDDFVLVARTEALIVGAGLDEALERAHAYIDAGADAILIHSKQASFEQIAQFLARWERRAPIVCVPTTYSQTPVEVMEEAGVSVAIWANYMLRAAITAMRQVAQHVGQHRTITGFDELALSSVADLFELQDNAGLLQNEGRFGCFE
jgi:phosphoenolpyruvate phosphomutase